MDASAQPGDVKLYGVVRDSTGCPRLDEPFAIAPEFAKILTNEDIDKLTQKHGESWLLHIQQLREQH